MSYLLEMLEKERHKLIWEGVLMQMCLSMMPGSTSRIYTTKDVEENKLRLEECIAAIGSVKNIHKYREVFETNNDTLTTGI